MIALIIILTVLILLAVLYVFSTMGRLGHPGLSQLRGFGYAHRGLHSEGVPENSLEAFRKAVDHGFGSELDVHLMADGNLAVIHDSSLKRTAGVDISIEELTLADLSRYPLEGTDQRIPLLEEVLAVYGGKAPLIVELKPEKGNHAALCQAVCHLLDRYEGVYCLESFDPRCIFWLQKNRPELIRGQLSRNFIRDTKFSLPMYLKIATTCMMANFLGQPDFVAYQFCDRKLLPNQICRKFWGLASVSWTIVTPEDYATALQEGCIPIFENFIPEN